MSDQARDDRHRAAAMNAADKEWHWSKCPTCERNHPPDRCDLADEAEDGWPWYGWTP